MLKNLLRKTNLGLMGGFAALLLLALVLPMSAARAELVGDTKAPFTAERTVTIKGKSYTGQMWAVPGQQRHEQMINGLRMVAIIRADQQMSWVMLPDLHLYTQMKLQNSWLGYANMRQLGHGEPGGVVAGDQTRRYKVDRHESDGSALNATAWLGTADRLIKVDGVFTAPQGHKTPFTLKLDHIEDGPQDPSLFELPDGMSQLPPEAIAPLLGIKPQ